MSFWYKLQTQTTKLLNYTNFIYNNREIHHFYKLFSVWKNESRDFISLLLFTVETELTNAVNKQSVTEAERFLQPITLRAQDANEISHGLTAEEIELPCLLLDWRNALLMHWGAELNREGESWEGVPAPSDPPTADTSWVWLGSLPGDWTPDLFLTLSSQCQDAAWRPGDTLKASSSKSTNCISLHQRVGSIQVPPSSLLIKPCWLYFCLSSCMQFSFLSVERDCRRNKNKDKKHNKTHYWKMVRK